MNTRRPIIYLFIILPILVGGGMAVIVGLQSAYAFYAGIQFNLIPKVNGLLISLPAFFLWIPVSLLITNCILFVVPPLRKIALRYAAEAERPDFFESQRKLGKLAIYMLIVCSPLIILGFVV